MSRKLWRHAPSRQRLAAELVKILGEKDPARILRRLKSWHLAGALYPRFSWPNEIAVGAMGPTCPWHRGQASATFSSGAGPWERLGLMALRMKPSAGAEFIRSLNLERPVAQAVLEALKVRRERASPRTPLDPLARRILEIHLTDFPKAALEPLVIDGEDLRDLGLQPGPAFKSLLLRAARAQWKGEFAGRAQALRWLGERRFR